MTKVITSPRKTRQRARKARELTSASPRRHYAFIATPRRIRLRQEAIDTKGSVRRIDLFHKYGVSAREGYRILKEDKERASQNLSKRGRKLVLASYQREAIETVEDANFGMTAQGHPTIARVLGLDNRTDRAIQSNMADYGVGTFRAAQKRDLPEPTRQSRYN